MGTPALNWTALEEAQDFVAENAGDDKAERLLRQLVDFTLGIVGRIGRDGRTGQNGRPREVDRASLGPILCERVAMGELLKDVCEDLGLAANTPWKWSRDDPDGFGHDYIQARIEQAHVFAERIIQISEGNDSLSIAWRRAIEQAEEELSLPPERGGDPKWKQITSALNFARIQRDSLRVNTLKWYVSKLAPKLYGEKLDITSGGETIAPQVIGIQFIGPGAQPPTPPDGLDPALEVRQVTAGGVK